MSDSIAGGSGAIADIGDGATKLVFEKNHVKVRERVPAPGEASTLR